MIKTNDIILVHDGILKKNFFEQAKVITDEYIEDQAGRRYDAWTGRGPHATYIQGHHLSRFEQMYDDLNKGKAVQVPVHFVPAKEMLQLCELIPGKGISTYGIGSDSPIYQVLK